MSAPQQPSIPVTADDVDGYNFDANASPPPGSARRGLVAAATDPGHLATAEEWAQIVAHAEGAQQ